MGGQNRDEVAQAGSDRIGEFWGYPESRTFAEPLIDREQDPGAPTGTRRDAARRRLSLEAARLHGLLLLGAGRPLHGLSLETGRLRLRASLLAWPKPVSEPDTRNVSEQPLELLCSPRIFIRDFVYERGDLLLLDLVRTRISPVRDLLWSCLVLGPLILECIKHLSAMG